MGFLAWKVTKALFARILFATHSIIAIWRLYADSRNIFAMLFALAPISLFLEAAVTILWRHGDEYKWFCPSIFIFLAGSVPPIWFMELAMTKKFSENQTNLIFEEEMFEEFNIKLPTLPKEQWLQLVEQSLLVVLILGRWLLPKGQITRDELSQLLLAYVAISADIIELFNMFTDSKVRTNLHLSLITLAVWSVSLIQFPLVITTVKSQKARYCWSSSTARLQEMDDMVNSNYTMSPQHQPLTQQQSPAKKQGKTKSCAEKCTDISVWGIVSTVLLQDGPFLGLRIYVIFWEGVTNYSMFFFLSKNSLIIMVQIYRLLVLCCDASSAGGGGSTAELVAITTGKTGLTVVTGDADNNDVAVTERFYLLQPNGSVGSSMMTIPRRKYSNSSASKCFGEVVVL